MSSTILPMLACPTSAAGNRRPVVFEDLMRTGDWAADLKVDGVRCLALWRDGKVTLRNRVGVDITGRYPEITAELTDRLDGHADVMIDGEVVAVDGSFESTLLRDAQVNARRIAAMVKTHPVMFVAFDVPDFQNRWTRRRQHLDVLSGDWKGSKVITTTVVSFDDDYLATTRRLRLEGVVAKHLESRYEFGKRSNRWLKFRNRYRVSCLVAGYYPGTGSRTEFGGMELALLGPDGPVSVGRVGTGFTERQIPALQQALDRGDLLVVEIETTNQTSGGQLRFPVFRGIRTDVAPADCSIDQLQFLPKC